MKASVTHGAILSNHELAKGGVPRVRHRRESMNKATVKKMRYVQLFARILLVIMFVVMVAALIVGLTRGYVR